MKRLIFITLMFLVLTAPRAQDINKMEYFIDADPGFGLATDIPVTSGHTVSENFSINTTGLTTGIHLIGVRSRTETGIWSLTSASVFFTVENIIAEDVQAMEYFVDTDPGFGLATPLSIAPGTDVSKNFSINTTSLTTGLHSVAVRVKNAENDWSLTAFQVFFAHETYGQDIVQMEYFVDADPGFGMGTPVEITSGKNVLSVFPINMTGITPGLHLLSVRVKNAFNQWSLTSNQLFFAHEPYDSPVTQIEYFFDADPGFGAGTQIPFTPSVHVDQTTKIDIAGITTGQHMFYIRVKDQNNRWSLTCNSLFSVYNLKIYLESLYDAGLGENRKAQDESGDHFAGTIADTLIVSFAETVSPYTVKGHANGVELNQNGTIASAVGGVPDGDYYLKINHRNSVETWSADPVTIGNSPLEYDFTNDFSKALGFNMIEISGVYAFYAGDANQDGAVDGLDMILLDNQAANFGAGYMAEDINGDGSVDALDMIILDNNAAAFVSAVLP